MTPTEYRTNRRRTANTKDETWSDQALNAALGLGEVGELQNLIKKEIFHGHDWNNVAMIDEAGDILYYLDWLLELIGSSIPEAMEYNVEKLRKRYPDGFSAERSINRSE